MKKPSNRLSVKQSSTKEGQRELLREHTNKINELIDIINEMQGMKPYTAMRSTGERIADEQENREKQMKEDIRVVLDEFWMNGKEAGYLMKYDNVITTDTVINKILAIVKGE